MEAPSTTSSTTSSAIVPLANEDIPLAILEACSKVMPEGHLLKVADFLKNINARNVAVPEVPAEVQLTRIVLVYFYYTLNHDEVHEEDEEDEDDRRRHFTYILTKGDEYNRRSYVKVVQTQSRYSVQVRLCELDSFLKICLKQKMFDGVKIITNDSSMPEITINFKEYCTVLDEQENFYDEFCKYTAKTIMLVYNLFIFDRDVIRL